MAHLEVKPKSNSKRWLLLVIIVIVIIAIAAFCYHRYYGDMATVIRADSAKTAIYSYAMVGRFKYSSNLI